MLSAHTFRFGFASPPLLMIRALAVCVAMSLAAAAGASTTIVGGNIINQTWTLAGSPYIVQGDITVPAGAFLTIEAGVAVQPATSDMQASGLDTSRVEITIRGTLNVNGTAGSPVTFDSAGSTANAWYGLIIDSTATAVNISHASIVEANMGIRHSAVSGVASYVRCAIATCTTGIYVAAGSATNINGLQISGCGIGVYVAAGASATLNNCVVRNNTSAGVYTGTGTVSVYINGCSIHANGTYGVYINATLGTSDIRNSIITSNGSYGVRNESFTTVIVNVSYCNTWNNSSGSYFGVSFGSGLISANPNYVAAPSNLALNSGSVCIDAGSPTGFPSTDILNVSRPQDGDGIGGAQADMGAYEFVLSCSNPTINTPPANTSAQVGKPAVFTVAASGSGALTYRWKRNGVDLFDGGNVIGAGTATLLLYPVSAGDAANYSVVVSNFCGPTPSTPAALTVFSACPGDVNGDNVVNVTDLLAVIGAWGACP